MYQTFTEIGIINQLAESFLRATLPKPMTIAQFHVLNHLTRQPGPHTPTQITNAFQVTKGAMTHTLGLLARNKWITVIPDPKDKRSKRIEITLEGKTTFRDTVDRLEPYFTKMISVLPAQDMEALTHTLQIIRVFMDENRDGDIKSPA